jgi:hypothetical protein
LYPFVTYMRWKNDATTPTFKPTSHRSELGFVSTTEAFDTLKSLVFNDESWAYALYKATYMFLKYGSPTAQFSMETEETNVKNVFNDITATSIRFSTSVVNTKTVVYLKSAFESLID